MPVTGQCLPGAQTRVLTSMEPSSFFCVRYTEPKNISKHARKRAGTRCTCTRLAFSAMQRLGLRTWVRAPALEVPSGLQRMERQWSCAQHDT